MFKSTLVPVGEPFPGPRCCMVEEVRYGAGGNLIVTVSVDPPDETWQVVFAGVIGVRILHERDLPEFWWVNMENTEPTNTLVARVTRGGWKEQHLSGFLQSGYYDGVLEYCVGAEYECVNVLAQAEPIVTRTVLDGLPG